MQRRSAPGSGRGVDSTHAWSTVQDYSFPFSRSFGAVSLLIRVSTSASESDKVDVLGFLYCVLVPGLLPICVG
jgi:hypothetical protein